jgi:hypothetical protein
MKDYALLSLGYAAPLILAVLIVGLDLVVWRP